MSWFQKLMPARIRTEGGSKRNVPEGLWTKCAACAAVLYRPELERNLAVCPKCNNHMYIKARTRLELFLDPGESREIAGRLEPTDPLKFRDSKKYRDRIAIAQKNTGEKDALVVLAGKLAGQEIEGRLVAELEGGTELRGSRDGAIALADGIQILGDDPLAGPSGPLETFGRRLAKVGRESPVLGEEGEQGRQRRHHHEGECQPQAQGHPVGG